MTSRITAVSLLPILLACAHAQPAPAPLSSTESPPAKPLPLPRSSIAAILLHQGELELTPEQVERLQARDDSLIKEQLRLREAMQQHKPAAPADGSPSNEPPPSGAAPTGGGHRRGRQQRNPAPDPKAKGETLEERLDDADTRAYLAAEADILTEKQRDPARDIASKYREDLYDQRQQAATQHAQ